MPRGVYDRSHLVKRLCSVDGCERTHHSGGLCALHHCRVRDYGSLDTKYPWDRAVERTREARFWEKVARKADSECWEWKGARLKAGYGVFKTGPVAGLAHRFAYELGNGPITPGMTVDHLCGTTACVNVQHMELCSLAENTRRGNAKRKAAA